MKWLIAILAGTCLSITAQAVDFDDWAGKLTNVKVRNDPEQAAQTRS